MGAHRDQDSYIGRVLGISDRGITFRDVRILQTEGRINDLTSKMLLFEAGEIVVEPYQVLPPADSSKPAHSWLIQRAGRVAQVFLTEVIKAPMVGPIRHFYAHLMRAAHWLMTVVLRM